MAWQCVKKCGACCHLEPQERPDLESYLTPAELQLYYSLVGEDGWCIHFDHSTRQCQIYADRPRFCRVTLPVFQDMYGIEAAEMEDFAIDCCCQQIAAVYGEDSEEFERFEQAVCQP